MSHPPANPLAAPRPRRPPVPRLEVRWEPSRERFLQNLADLFRRPGPPLRLSSRPAQVSRYIFVERHFPRQGLAHSAWLHALVVALIFLTPGIWYRFNPPQPSPFEERSITYYEVSEYLPPLRSPGGRGKVERKADPAYARQPIVSVPPQPDNFRQTIVNPEAPQLLREPAPLPNLVVWTETPAPVPVAASARRAPQLIAPALRVEAIAPPAPPVTRDTATLRPSTLPQAAVVPPPASSDALRRPLGELNIARLEPGVAAPSLPVAEQRAAEGEGPESAGVPPRVTGGEGGAQAAGRLIALGLDPVAAAGVPIRLPGGSRYGQFAAGPQGLPGASGAPGSSGGGEGAGAGSGAGAGPGGGDGDLPPGLFIGGGGTPGGGAVVGILPPPTVALPSPPPPRRVAPSGSAPLVAAARRPTLSELARQTAPGARPQEPALAADDGAAVEGSVFGPKRYYSMTLNMPNLTSAAGSWIVRFAELGENPDPGELTAPVATTKVDPAYPTELMRARVEGVVVLYAVIGRDGRVSEVRVLRGLDSRLDENARLALSRWRFRPGTRNGAAVELEAVVHIPFVARRLPAF
jgi:protein TonB